MQIEPAEALQLVNLLESAGRELLTLQKSVGQSVIGTVGAGVHNGFGAGAGTRPFGSFGGSSGGSGAAGAMSAATNRGFGSLGGAAGGGDGGGSGGQRDVVRLCAVTEVTSVLLCTLSMALSQVMA